MTRKKIILTFSLSILFSVGLITNSIAENTIQNNIQEMIIDENVSNQNETTEEETEQEYNNINETVINKAATETPEIIPQVVEETIEEEIKETLQDEDETEDEKSIEVEEEIIAPSYISKHVPRNNSFKSYMSYKAITSKSSAQYGLQTQAYTGNYGIRMVGDRYCIALGSYYTSNIGTKVDLVMANGNIIPCILADQKANRDTDSSNIRTRDGSVVEFVVDTKYLSKSVKRHGDVSHAHSKFSGEIVEIRIY